MVAQLPPRSRISRIELSQFIPPLQAAERTEPLFINGDVVIHLTYDDETTLCIMMQVSIATSTSHSSSSSMSQKQNQTERSH